MTITNPGAITNSGAIQFTNQLSAIAKINYFNNLNDVEYNAYENYVWYQLNRQKPSPKPCEKCKKCKTKKHQTKKNKTKKDKSNYNETFLDIFGNKLVNLF